MEKQPEKNEDDNPRLEGNDQSKERNFQRSKRIQDIFIGLGAGLGYIVLAFFLFFAFTQIVMNDIALIIFASILILIYPLAVYYFFKKQERYVATGLILIVVVPAAIIGSCLVVIGF